jgi:hypothetical protein
MTKQSAQNEKKSAGHGWSCHAERGEASMRWIPRCARNDRKSMLGMTKKRARNDETECAE